MNYKREIITTSDGSSTLFIPEINEHYHSHHGAVREAKHVFIRHGLEQRRHLTDLSILEVGFGTGLNAFLTAIESLSVKQATSYTALELFPLSVEEGLQLNYHTLAEFIPYETIFRKLHDADWERTQQIHDFFHLRKLHMSLQAYSPEENFDLVYFDAFGPRVQPEMWSVELFQKLYNSMMPDGILVTYCAKGQVKRDLKSIGFEVETLEGPPGKREMIRARKRA